MITLNSSGQPVATLGNAGPDDEDLAASSPSTMASLLGWSAAG